MSIKTLPPWVPDSLKKIIKKATNIDNNKRFANATDFKTSLHKIRDDILDWHLDEGIPTLRAITSFRILKKGNDLQIQKREMVIGEMIIASHHQT